MAENATYHIVTIPPFPAHLITNPDPKTIAFAEKFRELRLRALQIAPDAFARLYDEERVLGLDKTLLRLGNPSATVFLAVRKTAPDEGNEVEGVRASNLRDAAAAVKHITDDVGDANGNENSPLNSVPGLDINALLRDEWLGNVALLGPQEDDGLNPREFPDVPFPRLTAEGQPIAPKKILFRIGGTFVDPAGRGQGLGVKLMQATLDRAREVGKQYGDGVGVRVGLAVFGHNAAALRTYEKVGFRVVEERPSRSRPGMTAVVMDCVLVP